jgi:hypothetical protein
MNPIVAIRRRERSHRPALRVLGNHGEAPGPEINRPRASQADGPALRIVAGESAETAPVLLAGADARRRAVLRAELGATLPARARWVEADAVAEALECAASSRMVIFAGDLADADVESLTRLLGRRHPELPVICVDAPVLAAAGGRG